MNFIRLTLKGGSECLINLDNVIAIGTDAIDSQTTIFNVNGEYVVVNESLDEIHSTIDTMQRRNGRCLK